MQKCYHQSFTFVQGSKACILSQYLINILLWLKNYRNYYYLSQCDLSNGLVPYWLELFGHWWPPPPHQEWKLYPWLPSCDGGKCQSSRNQLIVLFTFNFLFTKQFVYLFYCLLNIKSMLNLFFVKSFQCFFSLMF